jgi:putative sigma-54 modulation protein
MKPNPNTAIPIHITPHHLRLTPALSQFVSGKIAKLPRFAGDAVAADIVLRRHHGTAKGKSFSASARLALPGRDVHATATHTDLYTAITHLTKKLARRSLKCKVRRGRAAKNLRRSARRNRPAMLQDALARWTDASAASVVPDGFMPVPEAASTSRGQTRRNISQTSIGLVERSTSSNPAHGISFSYLECLAGHSRARAGDGDAFRRTTPDLP